MQTEVNVVKTVLPGSRIGILGAGQLGRMIALEARKMGYTIATLDPTPSAPAAQVSDIEIVAPYVDVEAAGKLAHVSDVITYEFENVDADVAAVLEQTAYVPQGSQLLYTTQHRVREKQALEKIGIPVAPFLPILRPSDLHTAVTELGFPCVLKTSMGGYDGKGQWILHCVEDVEKALSELDEMWDTDATEAPLVLEAFVPFTKEISVIVARNPSGEVACFPPAENVHVHHILHISIAPARIESKLQQSAEQIGIKIAEKLNVVGLIAVEMFVTEKGQIFVNELAPRPHNSGHYTYDACMTSQFEQHVRAICNLPLGSPKLLTPVVMVNVLGEHVQPLLSRIPDLPNNVKVHLYGKSDAKAGRKMGHVTVLADTIEAALQTAETIGIWNAPIRGC